MKLFLAATTFFLFIIQHNLQAQWKDGDDGDADDTKYIQDLIDKASPGDTVNLSARLYHVHSIRLKSGVSLTTTGTLKQVPPDTIEDCDLSRQHSSYPLFHGNDIKQVRLTFNAETYGEALLLKNSTGVVVENAKMRGDSTKIQSFAGMYLLGCKDVALKNVEVSHYGTSRLDPELYQRGTGIRFQTCENVVVKHSKIHHNGENGIFFHSSSAVDVQHNEIHNNGMSGLQVAFGSVGIESQYKICYNNLYTNAADAIDINNPDNSRRVDLNALIEGNYSRDNGWVDEHKTRDGSGIATLVGLKNVTVRNNKSIRSNRPSIYIRECDMVNASHNEADNFAEIVGSQGKVHLYKNKFSGLRLLPDLRAEKLTLDSNTIDDLAIPDGIQVDSLVFLANELKGTINVNMDGKLFFKDNIIRSSSPRGVIALLKVNEAVLAGNQISMISNHNALYVGKDAANVLIEENKIQSPAACIKDNGSHQLKIIKNTLATSRRDSLSHSLISTNPDKLQIHSNSYYTGDEKAKAQQAMSFEGEGHVSVDGEPYPLRAPNGSD